MSRPRTPWGRGWIIPKWKVMSLHGSSWPAVCGRTEPTEFCAFGDSGRTLEGALYMRTCGRACACARSITFKCHSTSFHIFLMRVQLSNKYLHLLGILCSTTSSGKAACLLPALYTRMKESFRRTAAAAMATLPGWKGGGTVSEARKPAFVRGWKGRKHPATIPPYASAQAQAHVRSNYSVNPSDLSELTNEVIKIPNFNGLLSEGWRRDRSAMVPATGRVAASRSEAATGSHVWATKLRKASQRDRKLRPPLAGSSPAPQPIRGPKAYYVAASYIFQSLTLVLSVWDACDDHWFN